MEKNKDCIDKIDDLWNEYKYKLSGKISMLLATAAGIGAVLVGIKALIIPASVFVGLTNCGVFFAGLSLEKFSKENEKLTTDNLLLKRQTTFYNDRFIFPPQSTTTTTTQLPTPINEPIEEIIIFKK